MLKPDIGKARGPEYDVAKAIQSFLGQMAEGGIQLGDAVIKELIQNADDAGATEISVVLDERIAPEGFGNEFKKITAQALLIKNNAPFKKAKEMDDGGLSDFDALCDVASGHKRSQSIAAGRFGIGFNSVYFFSDTPLIFSRREVHLFDPNHHLFKGNGWEFPLEEFKSEASDAGPIKPVMEWAFPKAILIEGTFGEIALKGIDYQQAILRLPLRTKFEGGQSLYSDSFPDENSRHSLLNQMVEQASRSVLFLKSVCTIKFGLLNGEGFKELARIEVTENPPQFADFLNRVENESKRFERGEALETPFFKRVVSINKIDTNEISWSFYIKHVARFDLEEVIELRIWLKRNGERAIPWGAIAIPADIGSLRFDSREIPAWRVFLPLTESGPCGCVLNGAFFVGPSRQRVEFRREGSDEALRKTNWNKCLVSEVIVPMFREMSIDLIDKIPHMIKECPQDYLELFPVAPKKTDAPESLSFYLQQEFSKKDWYLQCFDLWEEEFDIFIGSDGDSLTIEMIPETVATYMDRFLHLRSDERKFIPWKLGDAIRKRIGDGSDIKILRHESDDVTKAILISDLPPLAKDIVALISRLGHETLTKDQLADFWVFECAESGEIIRFSAQKIYIRVKDDKSSESLTALGNLGLSFESVHWIKTDIGLAALDYADLKDFDNLVEPDDATTLALLERVEHGNEHDKVSDPLRTKPLIDFLCALPQSKLTGSYRLGFLVRTAQTKHQRRNLGTIFLKPEEPTQADADLWEGLLRRTFPEVDPSFSSGIHRLTQHVPSLLECLHSPGCKLEMAIQGRILEPLHRALQRTDSNNAEFRKELNRLDRGGNRGLRPEAYSAAKIILDEAIERWEQLDEDQQRSVLLLPIHREADGSLIALIEPENKAGDADFIKDQFYLQTEDDLKDAPVIIPERRLLRPERRQHLFYREWLNIEPRGRTTVLKECLKQIGKTESHKYKLLDYIARYYSDTIDLLEQDGEATKKDAAELRELFREARIVPCFDNEWRQTGECLTAEKVIKTLTSQGWKGDQLKSLVNKLTFPNSASSTDAGLMGLIQKLGIRLDSVDSNEIPYLAITSECEGLTLKERAEVIAKNMVHLPRVIPDRAAVLSDIIVDSVGEQTNFESLLIVDSPKITLPLKVLTIIIPEAADLHTFSTAWTLPEKAVKEILKSLSVPECTMQVLNSRLEKNFLGLWPKLNHSERISTLQHIGLQQGQGLDVESQIGRSELVFTGAEGGGWQSPEGVVAPNWCSTEPPNLDSSNVPVITDTPKEIIALWNQWCGIKTAAEIFKAVLFATKFVDQEVLSKAWQGFTKWLSKSMIKLEGDEITELLDTQNWVLARKCGELKFLKPSETISHPGAEVLAKSFWVVHTPLPKSLATKVEFKPMTPTIETIAGLVECLSNSISHRETEVVEIYRLVFSLTDENSQLKEEWLTKSAEQPVFRLFRGEEQLVKRDELYLGDKEYRFDYGNLLRCFAGNLDKNGNFIKSTAEIYKKLGVKKRPEARQAFRALAKLEGKAKDLMPVYELLVDLITDEGANLSSLKDQSIEGLRVLTCESTFEPISLVYVDPSLNNPKMLSIESRHFIINDRNRTTGRLVRRLKSDFPETVMELAEYGEAELITPPSVVEVSAASVSVTGPWRDWFEQLAFDDSEIREEVTECLGFTPTNCVIGICPVETIRVVYKLPDGGRVIPSDEWPGLQVFNDGRKTIFVAQGLLEKDYAGRPEALQSLDEEITDQVSRLLLSGDDSKELDKNQVSKVREGIRQLVQETVERPGVTLKRLRKAKREHFFHQYQDQTADPEFSSIFERYQSLSRNSPARRELKDRMQKIIEDKFVEERREQIRGYGYNEFSVFAELTQNAEDAYSQREVLELDSPPNKSVLFKYQYDDQESKSLVVEHNGRPFNCWRHGAIEQPNFKRDVEGVLRSAGSFKPHAASTSESEKPIGRFGLGFKCVYLITDRPKIQSGPWNFEIDSACIPTEVPAPDDLTDGGTRIVLPLSEGVKEEQDPTGERLVDLMPFLRQVNHLELRNTDGSSRSIRFEPPERVSSKEVNVEVEWVKLAGVEHVREGVVNFIRFRSRSHPAQLGLYIDPEGYPAHWESAFTRDVYAVLPLRTHLGCGLGLSHLFELQSGRTHLTDHESNQERFEEVAELICALPDALEICTKKGKPPSEVALRFWSSLRWDRGDRDVDALQSTLAAALIEVAKHTSVVPTLDPQECTSLEAETIFYFKGIPDEFQEQLVQEKIELRVDERTITLRMGNVVPERFRRAYESIVRSSGDDIEHRLTEIGWAEIGEVLLERDLLAERPNLLMAMARSLPDEDVVKVKSWLSKCLLKADDESKHPAKNLLPNRFSGIDYLPLGRMKRLHEVYDKGAVSLLKQAGLPSRPSIETIEQWVIKGLNRDEGIGLLRYLHEAGRWRRHYYGLGKLVKAPWFDGKQKRLLTSREANSYRLIPLDILKDLEFRAWLGIVEEGVQPDVTPSQRSEADMKQILEDIYGWWVDKGPIYSARYESKIYPEGILPKLSGEFFERDGDERRGWLKLFILACTYTMSWTDLRKQKTFLEKCEKRGWMKVFSSPRSSADDWIYILDDYLNEQIEDAKWYYWMKQFISIYQISNYLTIYVNSFLSIETRPGPISLDLITRSGIDPAMDRGGDEAPAVNRALGIGACFVLRELMRAGVLTNKHAYPHCYVPVKRVRDLFIEEFGCRNLLTAQGVVASKVIYELLSKNLGSDRATFNMSFDLPFLILAENPDLKLNQLRISG